MTPLGSADGHSVPTSYAEQLVQLLARWSVTPAVLLGGVGLTEEIVQRPRPGVFRCRRGPPSSSAPAR